MTKNTLLSTIAALTLFGATGIATAQSPGGNAPPAAAAPKEEMSKPPAAKPGPSAQDSKSAPKQAQDSKPKQAQDSKSSPQQAQDSKSAPKQAQDKPAAAKDKAATSPGGDKKASTTGAAPSGGAAAPPPEKRSQIASAIKQEKIKEVTNVNFNISIGARVPSTVQFYPIPTRIIEIYPEWRGYQVILVNGRYVIVRPNTYEIVYIIEG